MSSTKRKPWNLTKRFRCLFFAVAFFWIFAIIYVSCGSLYSGDTTCIKTPQEKSPTLKHTELRLVENVTAIETPENEGNSNSNRFLTVDFTDTKFLEDGQLQAENIVKPTESMVTQPNQDKLLPLREMFAAAGKMGKEKEEAFIWASIEARLTDLRVIDDKPQVLLLVIVSSAPERQDRRNAIREAWWKKCKQMVFFLSFVLSGTF